jgi:hypothetical protein
MIEKRDLAAKLHSMENGIEGVNSSPEILTKMAVYGYTPEKVQKGKNLLERAKRLTVAQKGGYGGQYAATDELGKAWTGAYATSMVTVKVARVAFKGQPDMLKRLNITGERNRSLSGWINDARIMYGNIIDSPEAMDVLAQFGYTPEKIAAELAAVEQVAALHVKRLAEKSEAQQSTVERDKAIDDLCNWYSDFRSIARIALFDNPQLLEALGIIKKS